MKCLLEENTQIYDVLCTLRNGYHTGDFSEFFPYLAKDCIMQSQWVEKPNKGYDAVVDYFTGKGRTLIDYKSFPHCGIVELIGNCNPVKNASVCLNGFEEKTASVGLMYTAGKLCLYMEQNLNNETFGVIVDIQINSEGKVKQIDLCMPELFNYRSFYTYIGLFPANKDKENDDAFIRVSEPYYNELELFLCCVGEEFDQWSDLHIPIDKWCESLKYWKAFSEALSFDEAFEYLAGVDYEKGIVKRPDIAKMLGASGKEMWNNRETNKAMMNYLLEWTELYKHSYSFIKTYGW